jgi:hypothetical protein
MGRTIIGIPCKCDRRTVPPRRPSIYERHRWDVLMDIKKDHPRLPVIIVTACVNCSNDPHLLLADDYWIKSYRFDDLKQRIGEGLQRKEKILFQPPIEKGGFKIQ